VSWALGDENLMNGVQQKSNLPKPIQEPTEIENKTLTIKKIKISQQNRTENLKQQQQQKNTAKPGTSGSHL
jgi:hypothetical protein